VAFPADPFAQGLPPLSPVTGGSPTPGAPGGYGGYAAGSPTTGGYGMGSPTQGAPGGYGQVPQGVPGVAIAVVDADQTIRSRLAMQLGEAAAAFPSIESLAEHLTGTPVVVVLGPSCAVGTELALAERLVQTRLEVGAILVATELSTVLLQQALRAGVKDVLAIPVDTGQLTSTVQRVAEGLASAPRFDAGSGFDGVAGGGGGGGGGGGEQGRVVTVFSTKGGAGKSVIASNVAVRLAQRSDRPVCLVDADLQFGDIAVMLKLTPQHTIVDAVSSIERLDAPLMQSLLITHQPSGLLVLPAPLEPAFADQIGGAEMVRIIEVLRSVCSHVVVDTSTAFNDVVLGLIEVSDDVLLVSGMDIPNVKNVKIGLQTLRLLNTPMSKLRLVLNRSNSKVKLDVSEVEKTLQIKADALIPSDIVVPQAVNKGAPVVLTSPKTAVAKALDDLAVSLLPVPDRSYGGQ
jgi:pilus assembly protein CpaE